MFRKNWRSFSAVAFVLLFFDVQAAPAGQMPVSPRSVWGDMQSRAVASAAPYSPNSVPDGSQPHRIAILTQRIDPNRLEVRVYQKGHPIKLFPQIHELIIAFRADRRKGLEHVAGSSVALVPSEKIADQWDIYLGVGGVGELCLADNIFVVRQVLVSSRRNPIEVRLDGSIHRLKPGEALLVM